MSKATYVTFQFMNRFGYTRFGMVRSDKPETMAVFASQPTPHNAWNEGARWGADLPSMNEFASDITNVKVWE